MRVFVFILLSLAAFAQSAPPKAAQSAQRRSVPAHSAPAVSPDDGSVNDHTYTSDYFGFRYAFPEGMGVDEDFMGGKEDESKRSFVLLAAREREEASNRTVVIMADNGAAAGVTDASSYLNKVATDLLKRQGFQPEGAPRTVSIAGRSFARADFQKGSIAETVLVTMLRGYAVNFVLMAPSREEVEELTGSLQSLVFMQAKPPARTGVQTR